MLNLMVEMAKKKSKYDLELLIALCWVTWHSRNLHVLNNKKEDFQLLVTRAEAVVQSYKKIKQPHLQLSRERKDKRNQQWGPPPPGWFKTNVDAVIKEDQNKERLGMVIRNSKGKCIVTAMKLSNFNGSEALTEVEATKFGLEIVENAKEVVNIVLNKKGTQTNIFWVIFEIQAILKMLK